MRRGADRMVVMKQETAAKYFNSLQRYFLAKILARDYEVVRNDGYRATVIVDDLFYFTFWVGNIGINCSQCSDHDRVDSIVLPELDDKLKTRIYNDLKGVHP